LRRIDSSQSHEKDESRRDGRRYERRAAPSTPAENLVVLCVHNLSASPGCVGSSLRARKSQRSVINWYSEGADEMLARLGRDVNAVDVDQGVEEVGAGLLKSL